MRKFRTREGPFTERFLFELQEIDDICVEALKSVDCLPADPKAVRIDRFVEKYFKTSVDYQDLEGGILGCTIFRGNGSVERVIVSSALEGDVSSERRLRATIAHEAGHGLLHASLFIESGTSMNLLDEPSVRKDRILCRPDDIKPVGQAKGYDGRWWEYQANRAIGGLLLPKKLVSTAVSAYLRGAGSEAPFVIARGERESSVRAISEIFDVNPVVARIRLSEMWPETAQGTLF